MKKIIVIILLFIVLNLFINVKSVSSHNTHLGIDGYDGCEYDDCIKCIYVNGTTIGDGINEKWYELLWGKEIDNSYQLTGLIHIDDDIETIYYTFMENGRIQTETTWSTGVGYENGQVIKNMFESSLLKWNDVYFYKYDSNDNVTKYKVVNLVSYDTLENKDSVTPNLYIYPWYDASSSTIARTVTKEIMNGESHVYNNLQHNHYSSFYMEVNLCKYNLNANEVILERTGAHEMGHVLGLYDIDVVEKNINGTSYHHEEVLMGYSYGSTATRQKNITYKDIAGVAITRGFHTDDDHMWLRDTINSTLHSNKYICSICNAVKYSSSFIMGALSYGSCNNNHALSSGNMMAVASYGTKDYYKCKYCRYVAPFEDIVEQNYSYVMNDNTHTITNNVNGLQYTISGEHDGLDCSVCGYHKHMYNARHVANNSINHNSYCRCGEYIVKVHAVKNQTGLLKAQCVDCGYLLNLGGDIGQIQSILKVSANGSKMLSTGIIILVDEDVETYLNGTLAFYNFGDNVSSS